MENVIQQRCEQRRELAYDTRDVSSDVIIDDIYRNYRFDYLYMSVLFQHLC
jgi:hypothetical protein